ncbi:MAG: ATP-binding protein [Myxococcales bacterium]|nr:ATP-binding protein [Myxococcales bacterium]
MWNRLDQLARTAPDTSTEGQWRGRFVAALCVAAVVASLVQALTYLWFSHWPNVAMMCLGILFELAWLGLWRRCRNPTLQADSLAAFGTLVYGLSLVFNKDISNLVWLGVMPLLALLIGGARLGVRWAVIDAVVATAGVALITTGQAPPPVVPVTFEDVLSRMVALLVVLPTVGILWDLAARSTMRELAHATEAAQLATREKLRFLANLSHELRTPLHGMLGMADLLRAETTSPNATARLDVMAESGRLLSQLIDDLLDVTKAEAGKLHVAEEATRLDLLLLNACDVHRPLAEGKGLSFFIAVDGAAKTPVRTDPRRFQQVVHNLVSNAVKFTSAGSVSVSLAAEADGQTMLVTLSVKDTGPGIPTGLHDKLFLPFSRVNEDHRVAGTGLGLSITRTIIERLGGGIVVDSQAGRGATFTAVLRLTIAPTDTLKAPVVMNNVVALPVRLKVLVVDDNAINRTVAVAQLEKLGAVTATAEDGVQALARLETGTFDLVLMDRHMPELDGLEATRRWRAHEATVGQRLAIVGITASAMQQDLDACREAGMDDVMTKPLAFDTLRALVLSVARERLKRAS